MANSDPHAIVDRPTLEISGLTKSYGGVTVLDHVDLTVGAGEVRALLGENGAGKSTLIKILSGVVSRDEGEVRLAGVAVDISNAHDARDIGIATLHQEVAIVPGLSVAENIMLGHRSDDTVRTSTLGVVRWREIRRRSRELLAELGQDLDVDMDADRLSPVGKTMTAIARALSQNARVLILDEPTAALTDQETNQLFSAMDRLRTRGVAIIYVSHRLEEVVRVCSSYSVLRNGVKVAEGAIADANIESIITAMAGRPVETIFPPRSGTPGSAVLEVRQLSGRRVRELDLDVRAGEIVGIAGLAGSGRSEIMRMLAGAQRHRSGRISVVAEGEETSLRPSDGVARRQRAGVALVPQERRADGVLPDSIEHNINVSTLRRHTVLRWVTSRARLDGHADTLHRSLDIRSRGISQQVLTLSGGNQQKVVIARFWALAPRVLLLDEPTRGVDVGTKSEIYALVRARASEGTAVLVVSSELPELLGLCDRVIVMHEGRSVGEFDTRTTTEDELLNACYGRGRQ